MQRLKQGPRTAGVAEFTPPLCLLDNPAKRRLPYACSPLLDMPRVAVLYLFSVRQRTPWVSRRRVDLESPVFRRESAAAAVTSSWRCAACRRVSSTEVHRDLTRCPQPGHTWSLRHIGARSLIIWIVLVSTFFTFEILVFKTIDL